MKDHEVREFVDELTKTAREHEGCQSLREAMSRVVKKHVTVLNQPHKCSCQGWGCMQCCSSEAEIRAMQGTFG